MTRFTPRILVLADDLTGANDTGIQVAGRGLETVTIVDPRRLNTIATPGVVVDTESRTGSVTQARHAVRLLAQDAADSSYTVIYKKVDSSLRGNIGAEIDELAREMRPDIVVCVPAYPANGRTTRDGIHYVHGIPLDNTELAADPLTPIDSANLSRILAKDGGPRFHHIDLQSLRSAKSSSEFKGRFISFDCEVEADLRRVVELMTRSDKRILWCGSAGLAIALLERLVPQPSFSSVGSQRAKSRTASDHTTHPARRQTILSVVGSASEISREQIKYAERATGAPTVLLDPASLMESSERERHRLADALEEGVANSTSHIVLAVADRDEARTSNRRSSQRPDVELSAMIAQCLADVAAEIIARGMIGGLILTGGATAYSVIRSSDVDGMYLETELETGVPVVRFIGGALDGMPGVTKAGMFGSTPVLVRAANYLRDLH